MEYDYLKLLLRYNALPQSERNVSIFEVSGYPHYENVCSNVLAFFLHPEKEHGLGCLLLAAVLKLAAGRKIEEKIRAVEVKREYATLSGGRLDLLIISDSHVIGIENKIFHQLHNDLPDYKNTIERCAADRLTSLGIILSLRPVQLGEGTGFINITYADLWKEVRASLGFYATSATQKWTTYLIDFMETTESLAGKSMELTDRDQFFIEHEETLCKLFKDRASFLERINSQVARLKDIIQNSGGVPKELQKIWIYASSCLVHDYILSGKKIAFDLYVSPKGWVLQLFGRNQKSNEYVRQLLSTRCDDVIKEEEGRFVVAEWTLDASLEDIKETLCEWMTWIVREDANRSLKSDAATPAN